MVEGLEIQLFTSKNILLLDSRIEVEYAPTVCTAGWKTLPNHLHPILVRAELEGKNDSSTTEVTITLTNPWTDTTQDILLQFLPALFDDLNLLTDMS